MSTFNQHTAAITYRLFGIPMQRRATRRKLVILTYAVLALLCATTLVLVQHDSYTFSYALYAAVAVGIFVFGGQGRYGLIKAFTNKPPMPETPIVDLVRLHLEPMSVGTHDTSAWKNDERELARRDAAHYLAYQPLAVAFVFVLPLAAWAVHPPHWASVAILLNLILSIALVASVLAVTLPSAIILWTEPDIDPQSADMPNFA
jgi:peptidoglycan/LPS O-acetylase OafA/YrhL